MDAKKILTRLMDISEDNYFETRDGTGYQGGIYEVTDDVVRIYLSGISWSFNDSGPIKDVDEAVVPIKDIDMKSLAYYDEARKCWVQLSADEQVHDH